MNIKQKNELTIAYLQTEFSVNFPDYQIWVSPLSDNENLKPFISQYKINSWAIITPFNPDSKVLSNDENEKRLNDFIRTDLHDEKTGELKWKHFDSISRPSKKSQNNISNTEAKPEKGLFIINIFPWEAVRLGHKYGQNVILVGKADAQVEIVWTNHESQIYFNEHN